MNKLKNKVLVLIYVLALTGCASTVSITNDDPLKNRVFACGAGFSDEVSAKLSAEYSESVQQGKAGVEAKRSMAAAILSFLPEEDRYKGYDRYVRCLGLDQADKTRILNEFNKEKYKELSRLKEKLSLTSYTLNPDDAQEMNKGTKKGNKVVSSLVDQVVKTFQEQSRLYDSHQHLFSGSHKRELNDSQSEANKMYLKVHNGLSTTIANKDATIGEQNGLALKEMLLSMVKFSSKFSNITTKELELLVPQE